MSWSLNYTSHLGYLSPDTPLFLESVGSIDPKAHVAFAASLGLAGVLYPWASSRPAEEVDTVHAALTEHNLRASCTVYAPLSELTKPLWFASGGAEQRVLFDYLYSAIAAAARLGSQTLAVLIAAAESFVTPRQHEVLLTNLRSAGDLCAERGIVIGIEPMIVLPGMFLRNCAQALQLIRDVSHAHVKLIFDTGHVHMMDGDVLDCFRRLYSEVCLIQLADMPNRVEPGAGTINFPELLEFALQHRFGGLVDFEHGWLNPGLAGECEGIEKWHKMDRAASARLGAP